MAYDSPVALRTALEQRLQSEARGTGIALNRQDLRRTTRTTNNAKGQLSFYVGLHPYSPLQRVTAPSHVDGRDIL